MLASWWHRTKAFTNKSVSTSRLGPGKGSGNTAQLVASKATQFGFADGYAVGNGVSKGMNIRAVAGLYRRNPTAVVVLADSDIKTPKDLEGKTIAIAAGSTQFQQWPAFVKGCGLDARVAVQGRAIRRNLDNLQRPSLTDEPSIWPPFESLLPSFNQASDFDQLCSRPQLGQLV
jgi:hypothetical protein